MGHSQTVGANFFRHHNSRRPTLLDELASGFPGRLRVGRESLEDGARSLHCAGIAMEEEAQTLYTGFERGGNSVFANEPWRRLEAMQDRPC
jgi:hypothetical protein